VSGVVDEHPDAARSQRTDPHREALTEALRLIRLAEIGGPSCEEIGVVAVLVEQQADASRAAEGLRNGGARYRSSPASSTRAPTPKNAAPWAKVPASYRSLPAASISIPTPNRPVPCARSPATYVSSPARSSRIPTPKAAAPCAKGAVETYRSSPSTSMTIAIGRPGSAVPPARLS